MRPAPLARRIHGVGSALFAAALLVAALPVRAEPEIVNDITQLNPIAVADVIRPTTVVEVVAAVKAHEGPVSIGGGRFSMGGQTATDHAVQIDMRQLDHVVSFSKADRQITVEAGMTWRKIQEYIDPYDLSLQIMQTYANFTVGGALSVNVHGRYVGQGPLVLSVKSIRLVLANGDVVEASPLENRELFYGAIGGYGALGVIVEATLRLTDNVHVERVSEVMRLKDYRAFFRAHVRGNPAVIFHNADIYPTAFDTVRVTSYLKTDKPVTVRDRLIPRDAGYGVDRAMFTVISEWPGGKWFRQHLLDPVLFHGECVEYRNYEASYDVHELEPASRERTTYVLQEYFVPAERLEGFVAKMGEILNRRKVNTINVSIRHALPDPGTYLAWARSEVFAFVLYYKQGTSAGDREAVGIWTRELIDAAIAEGGAYYLPYQIVATKAQFHAAYPGANALFELKRRVDPGYKFRNRLWDAYYEPSAPAVAPATASPAAGAALAPNPARDAVLKVTPGFQRDEAQTYLTLPEWILVFGPAEYASYLRSHEPSGYPYFGAIGQFWGYYRDAYAATRERYSFNWGYHLMVFVIGTSYTVENALKGAYERTIGWLSEWLAGGKPTPEDRFAARVAQEYVDFIRLRPWYEFSFLARLDALWREPGLRGPQLLRRWERRLFLSAEYLVKAQYATAITLASKAIYGDPDTEMLVLAAKVPDGALLDEPHMRLVRRFDDGSVLLSLPRYEEFHGAIERLARRGVHFIQVAGNGEILVTVIAPQGWRYDLSAGHEILSRPILTEPGRRRVGISVPVRSLDELLPELAMRHIAVEHIFDY